MRGKSKFDHKVTALAVMAKIGRLRNSVYDPGCKYCKRVAHSDGWDLRHCVGNPEASNRWYITHGTHGTYKFEGEDFTWPLL